MSIGRMRVVTNEEVIRAALGFVDFLDAVPCDCTVKPLGPRMNVDQWYVYLRGADRRQGRNVAYRVLIESVSGVPVAKSYREI